MADPMSAAMPYLQQIPGVEQQYYGPFVQQGQQAYSELQPVYSAMISDPTKFMNQIMGQYSASPEYAAKKAEMEKSIGNTMAAGGERGSLYDIDKETGLTNALMSQDMQQWLKNALGILGAGAQGEGGFYRAGYGASGNIASDLANLYGTEGSLAFQQERQNELDQARQQANQANLIGRTIGDAAAWMFM